MRRACHILLLLTLVGCSNDPGTLPDRPDADADADAEPSADDMLAQPDMSADDADADDPPDAADDGVGVDMPDEPTCAALTPAACMADPACTLDDGCVRRSGAEPFRFLQTSAWEGTAQITDQQGLPGGTTDVVLTLHRDNEREVRGIVSFPQFDVDHSVWGGVGPSGELGLYFGSPRCSEARCDQPFGPAYDVGGLATDLTVSLDNVLVDSTVTDFQTFVDMQLTPSDGFKPVGPIFPRADVLVAQWVGDMVAVDASGTLLDLHCDFGIVSDRPGGHAFADFGCANDAERLDTQPIISSADASSIAYSRGLAWFALGPDPDDLAFIGRVRVEVPWEGVVARRGDLLDGGVPIDPEDVPVDAVRGTFQFYAFNPGQ